MLFDAKKLDNDHVVTTDICIVGAGAAGITLAKELNGKNISVCLLEGGDFYYDEPTQNLYKGNNVGFPYFPLDTSRLRLFGGSTTHWTGWCRPMDSIDFEERSWVPDSGWPITRQDLEIYYKRAQQLCELGPYNYDASYWSDQLNISDLKPIPFDESKIVNSVFQFSSPTRFGVTYKEEIVNSNNIDVYINSNALSLETRDGEVISRLKVATLNNKSFYVKSREYIIATGGIENARLLLASNQTISNGIGNSNDLVGRYFMEHPHVDSGVILPSNDSLKAGFYNKDHLVTSGLSNFIGAITVNENVQKKLKILNYSATLFEDTYLPGQTSDGFIATQRIKKSLKEKKIPDQLLTDLGHILSDIDDVAVTTYSKLTNKTPDIRVVRITNRVEQAPNRNSRITLNNELDALSMPRVDLDWKLSELDKLTIKKAQEVLGAEIGRLGLGRLQMELSEDDSIWSRHMEGGYHHMGTTRMHASAKKGVTDANCKVHGVKNLYVAGSSLFTTGGSANPTLTIVALASRLADHMIQMYQST